MVQAPPTQIKLWWGFFSGVLRLRVFPPVSVPSWCTLVATLTAVALVPVAVPSDSGLHTLSDVCTDHRAVRIVQVSSFLHPELSLP